MVNDQGGLMANPTAVPKEWLHKVFVPTFYIVMLVELFFAGLAAYEGDVTKGMPNLVNAIWCGIACRIAHKLNRLIDVVIESDRRIREEETRKRVNSLYGK